MKVQFVFAAFYPSIGWFEENEVLDVLGDHKRSGYRWLTVQHKSGSIVDLIYDSEDMQLTEIN